MGFQIVVHHVGRGFGKDFQRDVQAAAEVGNENFDFGVRTSFADGFDAVGEMLSAAVGRSSRSTEVMTT